jgi:hypothetical protein
MVSGARWPDASRAASAAAFPVCCCFPAAAAAASAATVGAIDLSGAAREGAIYSLAWPGLVKFLDRSRWKKMRVSVCVCVLIWGSMEGGCWLAGWE